MNQEQVEVVEAERLEGAVEGCESVGPVVEAVVELARDIDVGAVDTGLGDRLADLLLVAVHLGGVDVAVAGPEGGEGGRLRGLGSDLIGAEAQLRNRAGVVERDAGDVSGVDVCQGMTPRSSSGEVR